MSVTPFELTILVGILFAVMGLLLGFHKNKTAIIFLVLASIVSIYAGFLYRQEQQSALPVLIPADDPNPPNPCDSPPPSDALIIYLGNSVVYARAEKFPYTILKIGEEHALTMNKTDKGTISLNATVRTSDGRIVATIQENKFHINPNNYFRKESDSHTLTVYGQEGQRVLYVRYLNPSAIKVLGIFNHPDGGQHPAVLVEEEEMKVGNAIFSRNCFGLAGGGGALSFY